MTLGYDCDADGIVTIALNQPQTRNALSPELLGELLDALEQARDDDAARVVVLASTHPTVFSSGGDLATFSADTPAAVRQEQNELFPRVFIRLAELGKPVICAAGGQVLAGALGLMLACDLVIAKQSARFGTPEIKVGLFPFMVTALLYRNVPPKQVRRAGAARRAITAEQAERIGLVTRVVADDDFDASVAELARRLAGTSPLMLRLGKNAIFQQQDLGFVAALEQMRAQLTFAQSTEDAHEGIAAFFEKREPHWKGH